MKGLLCSRLVRVKPSPDDTIIMQLSKKLSLLLPVCKEWQMNVACFRIRRPEKQQNKKQGIIFFSFSPWWFPKCIAALVVRRGAGNLLFHWNLVFNAVSVFAHLSIWCARRFSVTSCHVFWAGLHGQLRVTTKLAGSPLVSCNSAQMHWRPRFCGNFCGVKPTFWDGDSF